jgi:NAD(P)-dependent dehydrogenase (short-subunit alcohol dehydrogenase family)
MAPDFSVEGKTVLITGGAGGIGGAFARAFAEAGAQVLATDLREPAKPFHHDGITFEKLDVCDGAAVDKLAVRTKRMDVVIHCAGKLSRWEEYKIPVFQAVLDIHLVAAMRLANAFRPHLAATKGCIINIASMYTYFGAPQVPAYAAAKTAVMSLTKSLAIGFAADGIRVNAIAPGWIKTEISEGGRTNPEFFNKVIARLPAGDYAEPEELAGTALFLASRASQLINGVTIPVDGGYTAC